MNTNENPAYTTYDDSLTLVSENHVCDTRMVRRFFSKGNLSYLNSRARYYLGMSRDDTLRVDDLVDATFFKVCENAGRDRVLDKGDEDFQSYESHVMKAVYQNDLNSKDDKGCGVSYSRNWEALEVKYDTGDGTESFDRTNSLQMCKGDGMDEVILDMTTLVQDCKGCFCQLGVSYIVVIGAMCLFREYLTKGVDNETALAQVAQLMQALFGMSETETHSLYEQIKQDSNLTLLVTAGLKEPLTLVQEIKKSVRCAGFLDSLERMVEDQYVSLEAH